MFTLYSTAFAVYLEEFMGAGGRGVENMNDLNHILCFYMHFVPKVVVYLSMYQPL